MHVCEKCGFQTGRLDAFKRHLNRKKPCKNVTKCNENVTKFEENVTKCNENVTKCNENVTKCNENVTVSKANFCEICEIVFKNRQAKYRHKKKAICEPPPVVCEPVAATEAETTSEHDNDDRTTCPYCEKVFSRVDNLKRHLTSCQMQHSTGNITNNTTNNTTNNITINNTIHLNSYDNPSVDHVDMDVIKELYYKTGRNLKKLIHEGVRKIWEMKGNNTFNVPSFVSSRKIQKSLFQRNEPMQVYSDGDHRMLPANHVVDVVLQKAAAVCESHLRRHHYDDNVRGHAVLKHADVLEGLAIEYQETWDEDKKFRDGYKPFVQNALIECMLAAEKSRYPEKE